MLKSEHVRVLRLDRNKLEEHGKLPAPEYSVKALTRQLSTISDTTVSTLLDLGIDEFKAQLPMARRYGVSYVTKDKEGKLTGVSAATSLIKQGLVMRKHLILPEVEIYNGKGLDRHIIVGVFVRSFVINDYLPTISRVELAGWLDTKDIDKIRSENAPQTFQSKLSVVMIPCSALNQITTLRAAVWPEEVETNNQPMAEGVVSEDSRVHVRDGQSENEV